MFSLELESDGEAKDILIAELWDQGSTGIVEEADWWRLLKKLGWRG